MVSKRLMAVVGIGALLALGGAPSGAAPPEGEFTLSVPAGSPGTEVIAQSVTPCPPAKNPGGSPPLRYVAVVAFQSWGADVPVPLEGGPWEVRFAVPDVPAESLGVRAGCVVAQGNRVTETLGYKTVKFDVIAQPPPEGKVFEIKNVFEIIIEDATRPVPVQGRPNFTG